MIGRPAVAAALATACLAFSAGCGGDGLPRELTPGQRADLHTLVAQARTAAGAGDLPATNAALARLKARVRTLRENGALGKEDAAQLLKHAALAELKAGATLRPAAAPTPAPTPPAAPPPPVVTPPPAAPPPLGEPEEEPKDEERGKGDKKKDKPDKKDD